MPIESRSAKDHRRKTARPPAQRLARLFSTVFFVAVGLLWLMTIPSGRVWMEDTLRAVDRADRTVRARLGLPLRGTPDLTDYTARLAETGLKEGNAVFIRIFKQESELELWMERDGRFALFARYPICRWSGLLGPKLKEGDRQSPEGFYTVAANQLNPNSRWHRSFNLGFPNRLERSKGRTGSFLMVHGGCGSIGCYAMTNPVIDEIWRLVTAALKQAQPRFHVHVFPFRMTARNMAHYGGGEWNTFWRDLKTGYDLFEESRVPPSILVCDGRYVARRGRPGSVGSGPLRNDCSVRLSRR